MTSELPPTPTAAPGSVRGLRGDMVHGLRQLDVVSVRCLLIDIASLDFRQAWTITESGGFTQDAAVWPADPEFPGLVTTVSRLAGAPSDETFTRRIAPRRWVFGWRIEQSLVIVVDARFRVPLGEVSPADTAMLRLVCRTSLPRRREAAPPEPADKGDEVPPRPAVQSSATAGETGLFVAPSIVASGSTEDRAKAAQTGSTETQTSYPAPELPAIDSGQVRPGLSLAAKLGLGLLVACALIALWVAAVAVPSALSAHLSERQQQKERADLTMTRELATALATGDYGDLQTVLSSFEALGYFESALVTNSGQRIVAQAGPTPGTRIGDGVPPAVRAAARTLVLAIGSQSLGEFVLLSEPPVGEAVSTLQAIRVAAALAGAASLVAALLVALRRRRRGAPKPRGGA